MSVPAINPNPGSIRGEKPLTTSSFQQESRFLGQGPTRRFPLITLEKRNMKKAMCLWILAVVVLHGLGVEAQQTEKLPRIGFLDPTSRSVSNARIEAFRQGLRKLGYTEGKNIAIDYRFADGKSELLNDLASELVRLNVNIIVTRANPWGSCSQASDCDDPHRLCRSC